MVVYLQELRLGNLLMRQAAQLDVTIRHMHLVESARIPTTIFTIVQHQEGGVLYMS